MLKIFKNKKLFLVAFLGLVLGSLLIVPAALALDTGIDYGTATGLGTTDLRVTIMQIVRVILGLLGVIAIVLMIYGGWMWMTSAGNEEKISTAKRILINTAIGLAIILSSFMIASFIIAQLSDATGIGPGDPGFTCNADQCYSCGQRCNASGDDVFADPACVTTALCGTTIPSCGNGICEPSLGENQGSCPADCLPGLGESCDTDPAPVCGGGPCQPGLACDATADCTCQDVPIIDFVSPGDGAIQNMITIGGRNFGDTPGSIFFSNGFGDPVVNSVLADAINSACIAVWTDTQVIVVVPGAAADGPIRLEKPDTSSDRTDDGKGPALNDFVVNNITRPGLCGITPTNGVVETPVVLEGSNFSPGDNQVYFSAALAGGTAAGSVTQITGVRVPLLNPLKTSAVVLDTVSGQESNPIGFEVKDAGTNPIIFEFSPSDGAAGTYVTIRGANFGNSRGINSHVYFVGSTTAEADYNFPLECSDTVWSDNQVVVKVPAGVASGPYFLEIYTDAGSDDTTDLNSSDFDINNVVRPNICRLIPDNGPVGQNMTIVGNNFNSPDVDKVTFFQSIVQNILTINNQSIDTTVVSGALTGPVSVGNTLGQDSNGLNFQVGACSVNSCGSGEECCSAGIFSQSCMPQGECVGVPEDSTYTWFFSTESFGPKVVETCNRSATSCNQGTIASPTPYHKDGTASGAYIVGSHRLDDGAVPVDAIVSGMIDSLMNKSTINPDTIKVNRCNLGDQDFNSSNCVTPVPLAALNVINCNYKNFNDVDATCFDYEPTDILDQNYWYEVTLIASEIYSLNGRELASNDLSGNNYSWVFKTRNSPELSQVSCVEVRPSSRVSYYVGQELPWNAQGYDQDFVCVNLNPSFACSQAGDNFGWDWDTDEPAVSPRAIILSEFKNTATSTSLLEALAPDTVGILAQCSVDRDLNGVVDGVVTGQGDLEIDLSSPYVIKRFPDCGATCLNSEVGAQFNLELKIGGPEGVDTALDLYNCYDQPNCEPTPANRVNDFIDPTDLSEPDFTYTGRLKCYDYDGDGDNDYCLLPDSYYRVIFRDTLTSAVTNKHLVGLNYDDPTHPDDPSDIGDDLNAYSWVFKTQETFGLCLPDGIINRPVQQQQPIGVYLEYSANPVAYIPQCEEVRLDPYSFGWDWDVDPDGPADLLTDNGYQNSNGGNLRNSCGNGFIESGEDCDDGNIVSGDGCTGTGNIATSCLTENDPDSGNGNNYDVCGNGVIERSEMCESPGSAGCSNSCLLSGSVLGKSLCGDGIIGFGEECDAGERFTNTPLANGDGCSISCLVEDLSSGGGINYRNNPYCRSNSSNRFDFNQDPNSCNTGYTSVTLSSAPGNNNSGSVCGNALIEAGEECDLGGTCSDNGAYCTIGNLHSCGNSFDPSVTCVITDIPEIGCSSQCINTGSVLETQDPSYVGPYQIAFTLADGETNVLSWVDNFTPANGGPLGSALLTVGNGGNGNGPFIIDKYPDCGTACINAEMGATFSRSMNTLFGGPYSITNSDNITFYECGLDVNCNQSSAKKIDVILNSISELQPNDSFIINLPPTYNQIDVNGVKNPALLPNTTYRVVVNSIVRSVGTPEFPNPQSLVGLNYDNPANGSNGFDSFSWTFKTQDTFDLCQIGSVKVLPDEKTLPQGVIQQYYSRPRSEPDACDPESGQRLNPYFYNWDWDTEEVTPPDYLNAADLLTTAGYKEMDCEPYPECAGDLRSLCGNLAIEFGEDCDDGNLVGGDGCSAVCQNEGTLICGVNGSNCCGNFTIEAGEDCDEDSVYCDVTCRLTGNDYYTGTSAATYAPLSVCGNGVIEANEQCDSGNEPNDNDSDGCTDICLLSGSLPSTDSVCGDGQIGEGEECDDGQLTSYYCSDTYLACDPSSVDACGNNQDRCVNTPKGGDGCTGFKIDINGEVVQETCEQQDFSVPEDNYYAMCHWTGNDCQTRPCLLESRGTLVCRSNSDNSFDFNQTATSCSSGYTAVSLETITGNNNWGMPICGNNVIDEGEECDTGVAGVFDNTDGCSNTCTNTGQTLPALPPVYIGPFQLVETLFFPAITEIKEEIRAWATSKIDVVGVSDLTVIPSSQVPFAIIGHQPDPGAANQCRNVALEIIFSRPLDITTIEGNISLCPSGGCVVPEDNIIKTTSYHEIYGTCQSNQCRFKAVDTANEFYGLCQIDADCVGSIVEVTSLEGGFLDESTSYIFEVDKDNLKEAPLTDEPPRSLGSTCDQTKTTCNWIFSTNEDFCQCDHVNVTIENTSSGAPTTQDIFTCAGNNCGLNTPETGIDNDALSIINGNQHIYRAACYDVTNPQNEIIKLSPAGIEYSWAEFDPDELIYLSELGLTSGCNNDLYCLVTPGIDGTPSQPVPQPAGKNGESEVYIGSYQYRCESDKNISCIPGVTSCPGAGNCELGETAHTTVDVTNFICDNPWPNHPNAPFIDSVNPVCPGGGTCPNTNFKFMYCQDNGNADSFDDDIPSLVTPSAKGVAPTRPGTSILKELFFPVCAGQEECNDPLADSIAFRVLSNPMHLSPQTYYRTGFCGGQASLDNICYSDNDCSSIEIFKSGDWDPQSTISDSFVLPSGSYSYSVDARSFDRVGITAKAGGNDLCANPNCDFAGDLGKVCNNQSGDWERLTCNFTLTQNTTITFINALQVGGGSAQYANPSLEAASCQLNVPNPGSPESLVIDGYEAVRDGRSIYVGASNKATSLYTNIYLLSYSESATSVIKEIFERIIDSNQQRGTWEFNTNVENHRICEDIGLYRGTDNICRALGVSQFSGCVDTPSIDCDDPSINFDGCYNDTQDECNGNTERFGCYWDIPSSRCLANTCEAIYCNNDFECPNLECNAEKESIVRDTKRYGDLVDIQIRLEDYFAKNNSYPNLTGGSYVASTTFSTWPSWQQTLASDLQTGLDIDPINRFRGCSQYFCDEANDQGVYDGSISNSESTLCTLGNILDCGGKPQHCLPLDPDQEITCWDEVSQSFSCPAQLNAYAYRNAEAGNAYELYTSFENPYWTTPGVTYTLPLSNTVGGSCDLLNFELNKTGTINNETAVVVCSEKRCYGGGANPSSPSNTCDNTSQCQTSYGAASYCSGDADADGVCDFGLTDNCSPSIHCQNNPKDCYNPDQRDSSTPPNGIGDTCDAGCTGDADFDGICDLADSCPFAYNPGGADFDGDGIGNACDPCTDIDRDGSGDVITGGTDPKICQVDNVPTYTCTSDRSVACGAVSTFSAFCPSNGVCSPTPTTDDKFGYCSNDLLKSCRLPSECTGAAICVFKGTYNPYQEDFDNDKIGYIADFCVDFDKDGFGDWTFYTGTVPGVDVNNPLASSQALANDPQNRDQHFQGCQATTPGFAGFSASSGTISDLDNCPGGPNGANCKDAFGIGISCYNPAPASGSWPDVNGLVHSDGGQVDYLKTNRGEVCDVDNLRCGDGIVDFNRGEICDCGDAAVFDNLKDKETGEFLPQGGKLLDGSQYICITPNGVTCGQSHNGSVEPDECNWCSSCKTTSEEKPTWCGDGITQTKFESCDDGASNGDCELGVYGENCFYCDACQGYSPKPVSYCGDGTYDNPATAVGSTEQCDDGSSNGTVCSGPVGCSYCTSSCQIHIKGSVGDGCSGCMGAGCSDCLPDYYCLNNFCSETECIDNEDCSGGEECNSATGECATRYCANNSAISCTDNATCTTQCQISYDECYDNAFTVFGVCVAGCVIFGVGAPACVVACTTASLISYAICADQQVACEIIAACVF